MKKILEGINRFQKEIYPAHRDLFQSLADHQEPEVLFITCSDSRIVPHLVTQTQPGDLFVIRNAGNIVPPYGELDGGESATIEYAITNLPVKNVVICGHSNCGAMKGVLHPEKLSGMPSVAAWLKYGNAARRVVEETHPESAGAEKLAAIIRENVAAQLRNLTTHPCVAAKMASGALKLHGWVYSIGTGNVEMHEGQSSGLAAQSG